MIRTLTLLLLLNGAALAQAPGWPQWGGPQRNFMVESKGLAATWPADGPKRLWSRELGEGHSSIVCTQAGAANRAQGLPAESWSAAAAGAIL